MARAAATFRSFTMLDVLYLVIGAGFLGACILYVIACDNL
jgi:hypothetical protein